MTTIREFLTKLIKADKSAEELLDANLKRNNVRVDSNMRLMEQSVKGGVQVTSKFISSLAQEDVGKAIDLMSSMVGKSMLDMETMVKVFNGRYGLIITSMLSQVNGNMEEYNKNLNAMVNLTEDASLQADNLNVKWAKFKNNIASGFGGTQNAFSAFFKNILDLANFQLDITPKWIKNLYSTITTVGVLTLGIGALGLAFGGLIPIITAVGTAIGVSLPVFFGISLAIAGAITMSAKLSSVIRGATMGIDENTIALLKNQNALWNINNALEGNKKTIKSLIDGGLLSYYNELNNILSNLESPFDSINSKLDDMRSKMFKKMPDFVPDERKLKSAKDALDKLGGAYDKLQALSMEKFKKGIEELSNIEMGSLLQENKNRGGVDVPTKNLNEYLEKVKEVRKEESDYYLKVIEFENEKRQALSDTLSTLDNDLVQGYMANMQKSSAKTVDGLLKEISKSGNVGKTFAEDLVKSADKLGVKLTTNNLKNAEFVSKLSDGVKVQAMLNTLTGDLEQLIKNNTIQHEKYGQVVAQASLVGVSLEAYKNYEAMNATIEKLKEKFKQVGESIFNTSKNTKKTSTSLYDILGLTKELEIAQAKIADLGQSDLVKLQFKRKEMEEIFKINKSNSYYEIEAKAKEMNVYSKLTDMLKLRGELEADIIKANKDNMNKPMTPNEEKVFKNKQALYKMIDSYLASQVDHQNNLLELSYQELTIKKQNYITIMDMQTATLEAVKANYDILDVHTEILRITGQNAQANERDLDRLKNQYDMETKILDIKAKQLRASLEEGNVTITSDGKMTKNAPMKLDTLKDIKDQIDALEQKKDLTKLEETQHRDLVSLYNTEVERMKNKGEYLQNSIELTKNYLDLVTKSNMSAVEFEQKYNNLVNYRDTVLNSSKDVFEKEISDRKSLLRARQEELSKSKELLRTEMLRVDARTDLTEEQKDIMKQQLAQYQLTVLDAEGQKIKLEFLELQTKEIDKQVESSKKMYQTGFNILESMAKGEKITFDVGALRDSAINSLMKKTSFGHELKGSDYANVGAYVTSVVNDFMQTSMKSKTKELEYESKILDMRLQGATTEQEKLEIQKQQLDVQKQMIDAQLQQQTGFLGASGGMGGLLGGAFSGALAGGSAGGVWGAVAGGLIGGISGLMGGSDAEEQARIQKEQLEMQAKMNAHLELLTKITETTNTYMERLANQGSKVGIQAIMDDFKNDIVKNPTKYQIGGSATSSWTNTWYSGNSFFGQKEHNDTKIVTGTANLGMFGMTSSDLSDLDKVNNLQKQIADSIKAQQDIMDKAKAGQGKYGTHQYWKAEYAQAEADKKALEEMYKQLDKLSGDLAKQAPLIYSQYFGGTLAPILDADGKTITGYYTKWLDNLGAQLEQVYNNITNGVMQNANYTTSNLITGLTKLYIVNYSGMKKVAEDINKVYEDLSKSLGSDTKNMNMDVIQAKIKELIELTDKQKQEQAKVNEVNKSFIDMWLTNGGKISDILESMDDMGKSIYSSMKSAMSGDNLNSLGSDMAGKLMDAITTKIMDKKFTSAFQNLYASLGTAMETATLSSIGNLYSTIQSSKVLMEAEQSKLKAISDLLSGNDVQYSSINENIQYTSGTTKDIVNNYYNSINITSDFTFADSEESINRLAELVANPLVTIIKNQKS